MPISPMASNDIDKGLSQDAERGEEDTSVVVCTGEEEGKVEEEEEGRKAVIRRGVTGPTKKERQEHEATHCPSIEVGADIA